MENYNGSDPYQEKIQSYQEVDPPHLNKEFLPIKEEPEEKLEFYGEDLGNYIDKLNSNIERLKQTFENEDDLQENHKKNLLSMTSTSEYFDAKQLEIYNKFKINPNINYLKGTIHNRAISLDPQNVFRAKPTVELIEEESPQQRQSYLEINEKLEEDYPQRINELEKQNKEIKEFLAKTEKERVKLQEEINKLMVDQKNNHELLSNFFKENEKMEMFKKKLEKENLIVENERKELQKMIELKFEEFQRREKEFDELLKLKIHPNLFDNRDRCPCIIF